MNYSLLIDNILYQTTTAVTLISNVANRPELWVICILSYKGIDP